MLYAALVLLLISFFTFNFTPVFARVTPDDLLQQKKADFQTNLEKIKDNQKKQAVIKADLTLQEINQQVCLRFQEDLNKMAAILDEEKRRQNVTKTIVAYGQGNTPLDAAAYSLNFAAEALAYQKAQNYTPNISGGNLSGAVNTSSGNLRSDLGVLKGKILNAQAAIKKALDYEK